MSSYCSVSGEMVNIDDACRLLEDGGEERLLELYPFLTGRDMPKLLEFTGMKHCPCGQWYGFDIMEWQHTHSVGTQLNPFPENEGT